MSLQIPPVRKQLEVKTDRERAFRLFTEGMDRWWPREHHIGKSPLKRMILEPRAGGRWYSLCEDGSECDIGKVLLWEAPARLVLAWQVTATWSFDANFVTEVEVRFSAEGPRRTLVDFEHRDLERYAEAAEGLRAQFDDPKGWHGNLERYAATASLKAVVFYESAPDVLSSAPLHFPAHKARADAFEARGELLAIGIFGDPREGSMAVFRCREAAEEFVRDDPFVKHGVVARVTIKDWSETLLD
jgi:uncharacterized protein YciI